jgi:hypothetical protein
MNNKKKNINLVEHLWLDIDSSIWNYPLVDIIY